VAGPAADPSPAAAETAPPGDPAAAPHEAATAPGDPARRRRLLLVALAAAVAVLAGGGAWLVYGSPWLRATRVTVSGTEVLTPGQVRTAAAVPTGGPLASVDTGAVARRVRARLPRVDHVTVSRSWPHTIRVAVTERRASAVVREGTGYAEVDAGGVRFATLSAPPKGVPLVDLEPDRSSASYRVFGTRRLLAAAVRVSADLPPAVHRDALTIRVRGYDGISVLLSGGRTVVWGSPEQGAAKARVLDRLLKAAQRLGGARHFDVSAPDAPATSAG
jgi:cell division protein FtsQ